MQVAQRSTVQRFADLQNINATLQRELGQAKQQLSKIAEEKEAAASYGKKRIADRLQRRPERNRAFKVMPCTRSYKWNVVCRCRGYILSGSTYTTQ